MGTDTIFTCQGKNNMVSVPILLSTVDRRTFAVRLTDFEAIAAVIMPIRLEASKKERKQYEENAKRSGHA